MEAHQGDQYTEAQRLDYRRLSRKAGVFDGEREVRVERFVGEGGFYCGWEGAGGGGGSGRRGGGGREEGDGAGESAEAHGDGYGDGEGGGEGGDDQGEGGDCQGPLQAGYLSRLVSLNFVPVSFISGNNEDTH